MVYWEAFPVWAFIPWENPQLSPASVSQQHIHGGERKKRNKCSRTDKVNCFLTHSGEVCVSSNRTSLTHGLSLSVVLRLMSNICNLYQYSPHFVRQLHCRLSEFPFWLRNAPDTKAQTSISHSEAVDFSYKCLHGCRLVKFACWQKLVNGCNV